MVAGDARRSRPSANSAREATFPEFDLEHWQDQMRVRSWLVERRRLIAASAITYVASCAVMVAAGSGIVHAQAATPTALQTRLVAGLLGLVILLAYFGSLHVCAQLLRDRPPFVPERRVLRLAVAAGGFALAASLYISAALIGSGESPAEPCAVACMVVALVRGFDLAIISMFAIQPPLVDPRA